jgi:6-phosphogluconolactonase/glucosamine-6-phosphate isomerase/deaminase
MVKSGSLDISNVIVIGHEEAWGEYESGSKSDFDAYRKKEFFDRNNIEAKPIVSIDDVSSDNIQGNFIPMHLTNDAPSSAQKYLQILQALQKRKDVSWFGLYGVGTDGHIGEMQVHALGMQESLKRRHVYSDNIEHYSVERGAFQWKNNGKESDNDFHPESNIFWQRNTNKDIGRAVWQGYTSIKDVVSLGWREMIEQDTLILAFNDRGKSLAFQLALEGSLSGKIIDGNGDTTMEVAKDSGERGKILIDLENYALGLEEIGILKKGSVVENRESKSPSKIHDLFKVIYSSFDFIELSHDNPKYKEMWEFSNRYLGKTSPVSRLIKLRSMRGKETKLIATPEVIQDTPYEILLKE